MKPMRIVLALVAVVVLYLLAAYAFSAANILQGMGDEGEDFASVLMTCYNLIRDC